MGGKYCLFLLMAFFVSEKTKEEDIERVIAAIKSIDNDGYPEDKIQLIIIVNGENPPHPDLCLKGLSDEKKKEKLEKELGKDIVEDMREKIEKEIKSKNLSDKFGSLKIVTNHCNKGNKAIPLNVGFRCLLDSKYEPEYALTIDPDGEIECGSLKRLIIHFLMDKDKKVGAVGGTITVRKGCKEKERKQNLFTRWDFLTAEYSTRLLRNVYSPYLYHISGGISAFRKDVLDEIGKNKEVFHFINGKFEKMRGVWNENSVTEDHEITEQILDMGKKVIHEPNATYYGSAPNSFKEQFDRFRRWYGGYCQNRKYKRKLNCDSSIGSKLSRGWRAFSAHWYSYFWFFVLLLFIVHLLFSIPPGDGIYPFPLIEDEPLYTQFTIWGGIKSICEFFKLLFSLPPDQWWPKAFEPLSWWLKFPHIYFGEVSLCIFEFLFLTLPSIHKRKMDRAWSFIPYAIFLPFAIMFVNRIYWFIFSIYGKVSHKKLAW